MQNYIKKYDLGKIKVNLPSTYHIHELPLLSFKDFNGSVNLSLVYSRELDFFDSKNYFNIMEGYKLNLEKKLIIDTNENGQSTIVYIDSNGTCKSLTNNGNNIYTFNDESYRILRKTTDGYELENKDYSIEFFDLNGKLLNIKDKYGEVYLSYTYSDNYLIEIVYRGSKTIELGYSLNKLSSILYDDACTTLLYNEDGIVVNHYSLVTFTTSLITNSPKILYTITTANSDTPNTILYSKECKYEGTNIVLTSYEGTNVVDTITYTFPDLVTLGYSYTSVDITNKKGVTYRYQYSYDKLLYSYEVNPDASFTDNQFEGTVNIYRTYGNVNYVCPTGKLTINDGIQLNISNPNLKSWYTNIDNYQNVKGYYLLTGWIKSNDIRETTINVGNSDADTSFSFYVNMGALGKWHFFAYRFYSNANYVYVTPSNGDLIELKDLKLTFHNISSTDKNGNIISMIKEDVLIKKSDIGSTNSITKYPLDGILFCNEDIGYLEYFTKNDLLKYLFNKKRNVNVNEIYLNNGTEVVLSNNEIECYILLLKKNLNDYYLGTRYYNSNSEYWSYIDFDGTNIKVNYMKDNTLIKTKEYNDYSDVLAETEDGITISYLWENGLNTKKTITGSGYELNSTISYSTDLDYEDDNALYRGFNYEIEKYYIDDTWGNVYETILSNQQTILNTFDDDKSALTKKEFVLTPNNITHNMRYNNGNLTSVDTGGLKYDFSYLEGDLTKVEKYQNGTEISKIVLEEITHTDNNSTYNYPNFYTESYNFDKYDRLASITNVLENVYAIDSNKYHNGESCPDNSNSYLVKQIDKKTNITSKFYYDVYGKVIQIDKNTSTNTLDSRETYEYDTVNRIKKDNFEYGVDTLKKSEILIDYVKDVNDFNNDKRVLKYEHKVNGTTACISNYTYDHFKRLKTKSHYINNTNFTKTFNYDGTRISQEVNTIGDNTAYEYDRSNRINKITKGTQEISYHYDECDRLIRENNKCLDKTFIYEYNEIGNIVSKKTYPYTTYDLSSVTPSTTQTFNYDTANVDRLLSSNGLTITYNTLGYPLTYNGYTLTWSNGKLTSMVKGNRTTGIQRYSFTYNALGQRISKTYLKADPIGGIVSSDPYDIKNTETTYYYDNQGKLISEITAIVYYSNETASRTLEFIYELDNIVGMKYSTSTTNQTYYFNRNALGDVNEIYDTSGNIVVKYNYNAFGECTIASGTTDYQLARYNPIRYRGYYYDVETQLFYCNSRYYSPELCRWISPDSIEYLDPESINGLNLYCYCYNDPINYYDPSGHFAVTTLIILGLIGVGAVVGGTVAGVNSYNNGNTGWELVGDILGGALIGGAIGGIVGYFAAPGIAAMLSSTGTIGGALAFAGGMGSTGAGIAISSVGQLALAGAVTSVGVLSGITVMAAQTRKSGGYYGERWPGDPHKPDHVHLRGNGIDIRIGRDGKPLPGEDKLGSQARKALERLWDEFVKLFNRW